MLFNCLKMLCLMSSIIFWLGSWNFYHARHSVQENVHQTILLINDFLWCFLSKSIESHSRVPPNILHTSYSLCFPVGMKISCSRQWWTRLHSNSVFTAECLNYSFIIIIIHYFLFNFWRIKNAETILSWCVTHIQLPSAKGPWGKLL